MINAAQIFSKGLTKNSCMLAFPFLGLLTPQEIQVISPTESKPSP